jgi:2-dehydro-3-deoxyphosphogalactonate aldolase
MNPNPLLPYLDPLPLIAVLRGITPEEIPAISGALTAEGFRVLEVPLNSPRPFESLRHLATACGDRCLVGAGTVLDVADVARVRDAGGKVVVMPHADTAVIRAAKGQGLVCVPGVATPTEAFAALAAGADGLKMFPAEALPPGALKAWRAVLPRDALVFAVGGIRPDNMGAYWSAGASGFGTGSNLYAPGARTESVRAAAAAYAAGFRALPVR